jgi:methionine biosynthesis protein MetW
MVGARDVDRHTNGEARRTDFVVISEMVERDTRVLDVGCHDGALLELLTESHGIDGRGIELAQEDVNACVAKGLSVIQGDANTDLRHYPDQAFDYVILSQTIQATREPAQLLEQLVRIGRRAIVSFPNFGYWQVRAYLAFLGRMPVTETMPQTWYETPNVHYCTIRDFAELCQALEVTIERAVALDVHGKALNLGKSLWWANVLGEQAVFLLRR